MNSFFAKGIELAEAKYAETGNFKDAILVLEHTCEMCKSTLPCRTCVIDNKIEEFENPRRQVAATSETTDTITVVRKKTTTTTVVEEEVITYKLGDRMIKGCLFIKYRR
jgi:hypothetical protein